MAEFGFVSFMNDPTNYTYLGPLDLLPNPIARHIEMTGWGGLGMDFSRLLLLWPIVLWGMFFWAARVACGPVFRRFGVVCGIPKAQTLRLRKFQSQLWLFFFYVLSTVFGYAAQSDKPWLGFPLSPLNQMHLLVDHPQQPDQWITLYYSYEMGFFIAEIISLYFEPRRSDFAEYVAHHITTLLLMSLSFIGYEHRIGAYILIIHDISDILLCLSKLLNYCKVREWVVNICFASFVAVFFFTRLVCLPIHGFAVVFVATQFRMCTVNFWILTILLQVVLQGLHVYWFFLIIRMIFRLLGGVRSDVRSDDDEDGHSHPKKEHKEKKKKGDKKSEESSKK